MTPFPSHLEFVPPPQEDIRRAEYLIPPWQAWARSGEAIKDANNRDTHVSGAEDP